MCLGRAGRKEGASSEGGRSEVRSGGGLRARAFRFESLDLQHRVATLRAHLAHSRRLGHRARPARHSRVDVASSTRQERELGVGLGGRGAGVGGGAVERRLGAGTAAGGGVILLALDDPPCSEAVLGESELLVLTLLLVLCLCCCAKSLSS